MAQSSPQGPPTLDTSLGTRCRGTAWGHPAGKGLIIPHPGMGSFHLVWVWRKNSFGSARPHPKITRPPMVITELPLLGSLLPFQLLPAGPGRTACLGCWEPWGSPPTLHVTAPFPVSPLDKKNQVSVASPRLGTWLLCLALPCSSGVKAHKPRGLCSHFHVATLGTPNTIPHPHTGKA